MRFFTNPDTFPDAAAAGFPSPSVLVRYMTRTQEQQGGSLESRIAGRREELVARWIELIFGTYPEETRRIWASNRDRFTNPVGQTIRETAGTLFDGILEWKDAEAMCQAMERMIKIRTVQDLAPSAGLSFVFLLKKVLREAFAGELEAEGRLTELLAYETRVDNVALMAFDAYAGNLRQIFDMRAREIRNAHKTIMRRAKMIVDVTADEADKVIGAGPVAGQTLKRGDGR